MLMQRLSSYSNFLITSAYKKADTHHLTPASMSASMNVQTNAGPAAFARALDAAALNRNGITQSSCALLVQQHSRRPETKQHAFLQLALPFWGTCELSAIFTCLLEPLIAQYASK